MAYFAERLKSARLMNGFSLQDLADKLSNRLTKQALSKYELGQIQPDGEKLAWLSEALKVRPDYFTRETKAVLGEIEYRKLKRFSAKEKSMVNEKTRDMLERYLELEEILGIETEFENPKYEINSYDDVEEAAIKLRIKWKLGCDSISNTIELLEDHHLKVIEIDAEFEFSGMSTLVNEKFPIIAINNKLDTVLDRKRFTAIHELGHIVMNLEKFEEAEKEKMCHYFAGAFLFPKDAIENELGKKRSRLDVHELGALKRQYGLSIFAILIRAKNLSIITESYYKQMAFLISSWGYKKEEPVKYIGYEKSNRFHQLLFRALAEELISTSKAAALNNQKLAEFRHKFLTNENSDH